MPKSPDWRALVTFPNEVDQAERWFWAGLEFRVSREMEKHPICRRLRLWCDGFIPEDYLLDRVPGRITGIVWIGDGRQERWKFSLILPFSASGRADITWSDLLPASDANGWLLIDLEKKEMEVRLSQ
jgi:hypothetical protein